MILLQCEMDHISDKGGMTEVKHHFPLLGWNSDYPAKTSAQYLCSNKYFFLFSKQQHLLCEPHLNFVKWNMKHCYAEITDSSR